MDFMTCFLEWQEKDTIMVAVDRFSKLATFGPTKITTTNDENNKGILQHVG